MSEPIDDDDWRRDRDAGKGVDGTTECPICDAEVRKNNVADHIRDEHSSDSEFPPEP